MNVFVFSSWFPSRVHPTLGNFNEKFAEAAALFNDVTAIYVAAEIGLTRKFELIESEERGVKKVHIYFPKKEKENAFDKLVKGYRYFKYYKKAYRHAREQQGKPDVIHLNIIYPVGLFVLLLHKFEKIPYVISENYTGYLKSTSIQIKGLRLWLSRKITNHAARLLPVTVDLKNAMKEHGFQGEYELVPNVTDITHFYPAQEKVKRTKKRIIHVSSLDDDHKNVTGILKVMLRLSRERDDFELHIIGDGDIKPHLHTRSQLGLTDEHVFFSGEMPPQQIAEAMRKSDFFLLFSNYENLPCVIVEALACGLPVVSSTAGGIAEHITEDLGILLAPRDKEALYQACHKMLDNLSQYDANHLHRYAKDHFSYESVGKKLSGVYGEVG